MTAVQMFTRYARYADKIAGRYRVPGCDADDVRQEARIGLSIASRNYDPATGVPFPAWAGIVIERRLSTFLKAALAAKHRVLTDADRDEIELEGGVDVVRVVVARDALARLGRAVSLLSPAERETLARIVDGLPHAGKADDNARYRVRRS